MRHPEVEITTLTSRQEGNPHVASVHPSLAGRLDLRLDDMGAVAVASRADCVFSCLPHGVSATVAPHLLAAGAKLIDFSADYRLDDAATYQEWYGQKHADPERAGKVVYGLPELFREKIVGADDRGQPWLLSHVGHPRARPAVEGRPRRADRHHRRLEERRERGRAARRSSPRISPSATKASRPTTSAATGTRPRSSRSSAAAVAKT